MILRESATIIIICVIAVCGVVGFVSSYFLGPDNPLEETGEVIIKVATGEDVEFSPDKEDE